MSGGLATCQAKDRPLCRREESKRLRDVSLASSGKSLRLIKWSPPLRSLQDRIEREWRGIVTLFYGDMRAIELPQKVDILVSELLGSFGDNELSPECLDGAQRFLKRSFPVGHLRFVPY
jgi:hypothetical protein